VTTTPLAVRTALRRLAGTERLLIYDVPAAAAPSRPNPATPYVSGSPAWWRFVERRRSLDDGANLTLLVSLRGLRAEERLLVVSWGSAYANAFLLVEPADPWLDLTTPAGIEGFSATRPAGEDADALVRAAYADWVYWRRGVDGELESVDASIDVSDPTSTLWRTLWQRLPAVFPPDTFLASLTLLNLRESELFTGGRPVARAIVPFLTRLGLPILYDARHVVGGVRKLVDSGLAWVQDPADGMRVYRGPEDSLPPWVTDDQLAMMLR
jgi:hypothetical protein